MAKKKKKKALPMSVVIVDHRKTNVTICPSSTIRVLEGFRNGKWELMYDVPFKGAEFTINKHKIRARRKEPFTKVRLVSCSERLRPKQKRTEDQTERRYKKVLQMEAV